MIGLVSLVSIVMDRSAKKRSDKQQPGLLAGVETQPNPETQNLLHQGEPSGRFKVVQASAVDIADDSPGAGDSHHAVRTASGEFVEQIPGAVPAGNFHSPRYGYTVALAGTRWTRWDDLATVAPAAEWGALLKNYGRFLVMPVLLTDAETSPESVDRALLAQFGFEYPRQRSTDLETFQRWGAEGHVFHISREISGRENVYRIWILRRDRNAYLVAAWIDRTAAMNALATGQNTGLHHAASIGGAVINGAQFDMEIDAQLDEVLNRFKLDDMTAAGAQSGTDQRQPLRHLVRIHLLQALFDH